MLDGDDKWELDDGRKVRAEKGMVVVSKPELLTLALKRFAFDAHAMRRVKVNDAVGVPLVLDLDGILQALPAPPLPHEHQVAAAQEHHTGVYDLVAIFLHSGTATGGHYSCFVRVHGTSRYRVHACMHVCVCVCVCVYVCVRMNKWM